MYRRVLALTLVAAAVAVFWFAAKSATAAPPVQDMKGDPTRGAYMFAAAAGCGCHITDKGFLAGGAEYDLGPAGKVYSRNITSDPETGIGNWTEADIVGVLHTGKTPDGELLFPIMPYHTYSGMADQDAYDLASFIKTVPAVKNETPKDQLNIPVPPFTPLSAPATAPTEGVERGKYLVNYVSDCSGCHTPSDAQGNPDMSKFLAGGPVEGEVSANITPDNETGIGTWTEQQIADLLGTGKRPDGSSVGGLMAQVVAGGFSKLTEADRLAIAAYIKTVPAVHNVPSAPQLPATGGNPTNMPLLASLFAIGGVLLLGGAFVWRTARRKN
jgi:mono/diheme cytochrome c family protein